MSSRNSKINFDAFVEQHKSTVIKMMEERATLSRDDPTAAASGFWSPLAGTLPYLLDLSPRNLRNIRYHTWPFAGFIEDFGLWGGPRIDEYADELLKNTYTQATVGVPEKYWLSEPPAAWEYGPLGKTYRGRTINSTIVRFQAMVSNLYHVGALQSLDTASERQIILEVGGGYGGLAQALGEILKSKVTYIMIDLPEMLFVAGVYLALTGLDSSIYVYDNDSFTPEFVAQGMREYDFVLVPNFALRKLQPVDNISLMLNTESFQEMTHDQVEQYIEFGANRITGYLYSHNTDRHRLNPELSSLSTVFAKYFDLYPDPSYYGELFKDGRSWGATRRHYLGVPKGLGRTIPKTTIVGVTDRPVRRPLLRLAVRLTRRLIPRRVRQLVRAALEDAQVMPAE